MKKLLLGLAILSISTANAQNGLENIIVEKYYVSDGNDTTMNSTGGVLPAGSVTYRIYADLLPGYKFQAAYGVPDHELRIQTTTLFFNNEDRGAISPTYSKSQAANNTVMLDSWLSVGAACNGQFGILKSEDDGVSTVMNNDAVLQNTDTAAGIPLTMQDGMVAGAPEAVTIVGLTTESAMFDNQNDGTNGPLFTSFNGSWASLNGSIGPDTVSNKVLIAQITTDGTFTFELNIQIGTPSGGVENYVARNPVANEILFPQLIYSSLSTDVKEAIQRGSMFIVYPNPSMDKISLEVYSPRPTTKNFYSIYDMGGKVVLSGQAGIITDFYSEVIDISNLSAGQYIIELSLDGDISRKQISKN